MVYIEDVQARQILDSRGNPTLEVDVKPVSYTHLTLPTIRSV